MPSWTYLATPAAACWAGLEPWFLDVNSDDWQLKPDMVHRALTSAPGELSAVIVVAPFGSRFDSDAWDDFARESGLPVVIDAAAGFDTATAGEVPVMVSLHATKPLSTGEGGLVMTRNKALSAKIRALSQYGFADSHNVTMAGQNAKLSEYAAAVGLAALDGWPERREALLARTTAYLKGLAASPDIRSAPGTGTDVASSTLNVVLNSPNVDEVMAELAANGIETRQWWHKGCHVKPAYANCPRTNLPVTEDLAQRMLSLPFFADLAFEDIDRVCRALSRCVRSGMNS